MFKKLYYFPSSFEIEVQKNHANSRFSLYFHNLIIFFNLYLNSIPRNKLPQVRNNF